MFPYDEEAVLDVIEKVSRSVVNVSTVGIEVQAIRLYFFFILWKRSKIDSFTRKMLSKEKHPNH